MSGSDWFRHALDVAGRLDGIDPDVKMVALLHDVLEDGHATVADIKAANLPSRVVYALQTITRRKDETYRDYIIRINRDNMIAKWVKIADLKANLDRIDDGYWSPATSKSMRARYVWALNYLEKGR